MIRILKLLIFIITLSLFNFCFSNDTTLKVDKNSETLIEKNIHIVDTNNSFTDFFVNFNIIKPLLIIVFLTILFYLIIFIKNIISKHLYTNKIEINNKFSTNWLLNLEYKKYNNKSEFYKNLNIEIRKYFIYKWLKNADKLTFKEIKDSCIINEDILLLFKESYINEFNDEAFDYNELKIILKKILNIINKNV